MISGQTLRDTAQLWHLSKTALGRHKVEHVGPTMESVLRNIEGTPQSSGDNHPRDLYSRAEALLLGSQEIFRQASEGGNARLALAGVREVRGCIELIARLTVASASGPAVPRPVIEDGHNQGLDSSRWRVVCDLLGDVLGRWYSLANTVAGGLRDLGLYDAAETVLRDVPETLRTRPEETAYLATDFPRWPSRALTTLDLSSIGEVLNQELARFDELRYRIRARFSVIEADLLAISTD